MLPFRTAIRPSDNSAAARATTSCHKLPPRAPRPALRQLGYEYDEECDRDLHRRERSERLQRGAPPQKLPQATYAVFFLTRSSATAYRKVPPMAIVHPAIFMGAMLSPKAIAQPTMMMARLAVLATE